MGSFTPLKLKLYYDETKIIPEKRSGFNRRSICCSHYHPSYVIGKNPPSDKINIGQIGCGRIGMSLDLPAIIKFDIARVIACSDLDSNRLKAGKLLLSLLMQK